MCEDFDSGLDSGFDSGLDSGSDLSADDWSGVMDDVETPADTFEPMDDYGSMDDFEPMDEPMDDAGTMEDYEPIADDYVEPATEDFEPAETEEPAGDDYVEPVTEDFEPAGDDYVEPATDDFEPAEETVEPVADEYVEPVTEDFEPAEETVEPAADEYVEPVSEDFEPAEETVEPEGDEYVEPVSEDFEPEAEAEPEVVEPEAEAEPEVVEPEAEAEPEAVEPTVEDAYEQDMQEMEEQMPESAQDRMMEYISSHNYGREDYETYSKDPEWQELNNELLQEMGREPIEYGETLPEENQDASFEDTFDVPHEESAENPPEMSFDVPHEETTENSERSAQDRMMEYMSGHEYGRGDYETYSRDPEWQMLNNELLQENGEEPIDYSELPPDGRAMDRMTDYITEHEYGREDYETYSKDPVWQQLNNDLLREMGQEPIDYGETIPEGNQDTGFEDQFDVPHEEDVENPPEVTFDVPHEVPADTTAEKPIETTPENPDGSAMDRMTEYITEHEYGREDYETYSKDPEWQQLNNDLLQEMGKEPIDYSETVESTAEAQERIEPDTPEGWMNEIEVDNDLSDIPDGDEAALEKPEVEKPETGFDIPHNNEFTQAMLEQYPDLNDMFERGEFYEQGLNEYGYSGTCGETTQANTLNRIFGTNEITENDVLTVALDNNLCNVDPDHPENSGGTGVEEFNALFQEMNHRTGDQLEITYRTEGDAPGLEEMAQSLESGKQLDIAVDSYQLWGQERPLDGRTHYTDHWIEVTGVDRNADGEIQGFSIVDSGGGESYLTREHFERCYYGPKDDPVVDPTCFEISKKETGGKK